MKASRNPFILYLWGYDWTGRTTRAQFLIVAGFSLAPIGIGRLLGVDYLDGGPEALALTLWGALAVVPLIGHSLRRLGDAGLSAWLVWSAAVPVVNLALLAVLIFAPTNPRRLAEASQIRLLGYPVGAVIACLVLSRIWLVPVLVDTADMEPLLEPGDIVMVWRGGDVPPAGDLIVLRDPTDKAAIIRRVIATGPDTVELVQGVPATQDGPASHIPSGFDETIMAPEGPKGVMPRCLTGSVGQGALCQRRLVTEVLPNGATYLLFDTGAVPLDTMQAREVAAGQLFVLSDNRDQAVDSRIAVAAGGIGMVEASAIRGEPAFVVASFAGRWVWQVWTWRPERFLKGV